MLKRFLRSLKESIFSIIPITVLIMVISFFVGIEKLSILAFILSALFLTIGFAFFTFGAELSMVTIGNNIGSSLIKNKKIYKVLLIGLIIGFVITIAEPDLIVLSSQLTAIPSYIIIALISLGVGIFLMIALFRIIKNININKVLLIGYGIVLLLLIFVPKAFASISFDAGGVTTGPMSVPFIVALGLGFARLSRNRKGGNDNFGLVGIASIGPIIMIMILGLFFNLNSQYDMSNFTFHGSLFQEFMSASISKFTISCVALAPILFVFIIFELRNDTIDNYGIRRVVLGLICTLLGLTIFLTGVEVGFIKMGFAIGKIFTEKNMHCLLIIVGMIIGYLIVKAEPAVKVLVEEVSSLTEGSISKKMINFCLSLGVCFAVGISLIRVFTGISILYFVVPGYILALVLAYLTPDIFTAIAFDSGGAASGPLTTSFLLPILIGATSTFGGNILTDAFGIVGLVSLSPLIMIQLVGLIYGRKIYHHNLKMVENLDESIIDYGGRLCK